MTFEIYKPEAHRTRFLMLLESRRLPYEQANFLPEFGYMALGKHGFPIAAGFFRYMEGFYGTFDSFITHGDYNGADRHDALEGITTRLIDHCKESHLKTIFAFSEYRELIERMCDHGFKKIPYEFAILNI
jgi:hypothetical protein